MNKAFTPIILLFLLFAQKVSAESYVIQNIDIIIDGPTRESAVRDLLSIPAGQEFESQTDVDLFLKEKEQLLLNQRIFESVVVSYKTDSIDANNYHLDVLIEISDSWTFIPIPLYKFDSNIGHIIGCKIYYDNLFGTLIHSYFGAQYNKRDWFTYLQLENIQIMNKDWDITLRESFTTEERVHEESGEKLLSFDYLTTSLSFGAGAPVSSFLRYGLNFAFQFSYNQRIHINEDNVDLDVKGASLSFSNGLSYGEIDWKDNLKEGLKVRVSNDNSFNFNEFVFDSGLSASMTGFTVYKFLNPSIRLSTFHKFYNEKNNAGEPLRGIEDNRLWGVTGIFFNSQIGIRLLHWDGFFEIQMNPFFDSGIVQKIDEPFDFETIKNSTGVDVLFFIDRFKSFVMRASYGIDIEDPREKEFTISSSLFY
jgi:outer membrane protein assembly factor BamA